nr:hypothetical protein [Tanacetum cinerariifolium]
MNENRTSRGPVKWQRVLLKVSGEALTGDREQNINLKLVSCKWLFKIKEGIEGVQKHRYKARLVARGFIQRADYELEQLDVKTTFLHENLKEVIYMRQLSGYEQCNKSKAEIGSTKSLLKKEFDVKELEEAKKILGREIVRDRSRKIMRVSQFGYVSKILNNFRIDNRKSVKMPLGGHFKLSLKDCPVRDCDVERMSKVSYANVVGSLMYFMVCTRLDIAYAVSLVSRYLENPGKNHWEAVKLILKHLRGTAIVGLVYGTNRVNHMDVTCFVYSDYAKDPIKEAEYMALTEAVKEAIWLKGLMIDSIIGKLKVHVKHFTIHAKKLSYPFLLSNGKPIGELIMFSMINTPDGDKREDGDQPQAHIPV